MLFKLDMSGSNPRQEIRAGVTTFMTMAYVIVVHSQILADAGMPRDGVIAATCLAAAGGSLLMGLLTNYPFALAPGMGLNAFFAIAMMPLAFSIAEGIIAGVLAYTALKVLSGRFRQVGLTLWILSGLFVLRFFI